MSLPPDSCSGTFDPETTPARRPGEEPLPGYRLLELLGSGGFGEVWKCEVPGGLCKAIKFVNGRLDQLEGGNSARQELEALQHVKGVRHPFLLSMERVEIIDGELMIVMELADQNLHDYCQRYLAGGQAGIPRSELLAFLLEAAEALDFMNFQHKLQHLDIKPRNLFLISNHVKVADFGLVHGLQELASANAARQNTAITPQYAAPEVFKNSISRHSDQYSLAVLYQELLTGVPPFDGRNLRQLMMQHLLTPPNLESLPVEDRPLVARALAKDPEQRFGSCLEFINSLVFASDSLANWLPVDAQGQLAVPPSIKDSKSIKSTLTLARAALAGALERQGVTPHTPPRPAQTTTTLAAGAGETVNAAKDLAEYQFVECLHHGALAEVWSVRHNQGSYRLAQRLQCPEGQVGSILTQLRDLRHPGLQPRVALADGSGRILVLEALQRRTLRDRHKECAAKGLPGIPRLELLEYLEQAALVLDHFAKQLPHLGLHPRCLVLDDDDRVVLSDLGLVALAWLPTQQPAGPLNPRYAAPELDRPGGDSAADQYSLATIYVELLTSLLPMRSRHRGNRGPAKLDLDMVPATDRAAIARALEVDPRQRHASCLDFLRALKGVAGEGANGGREQLHQLAPVVSVAQLLGGAGTEAALPTAAQLANHALTAVSSNQLVCVCSNFRYRLQGKKFIEHQCPVRLFQGGLKLKLQGFHEQWKGTVLQQDRESFTYHVHYRRSLWQRCVGRQPGVEVHVRLEPTATDSQLFLGRIRLQPAGGSGDNWFQEIGPLLLQSLRSFLQVSPERRAWERWTFQQQLLVYPVLPTLEVGPPSPAWGKDLSTGDVGFLIKEKPAGELVYVQLGTTPPLADYRVLARLVRCQPYEDGFAVGAVFVVERPAGAA